MKDVSHQKQFDYLKNAISNDSLHHSYIFYGPKGAGKFDFTLFFARYVQCEEKGEAPCEECKNCKVNKNGFIVDSYVIDLGKENNIKIEEIYKIRDIVEHSSMSGNHKIVIVNDAHKMTREAREVLLKTLEEPPEKALIILITDEIKKFPKTIMSRCPAIFFPRHKIEKENIVIKEEKKKYIEIAKIINFDKKDFLEELQNLSVEELQEKYRELIGELEILFSEECFAKMILAKEISEENELNDKVEKWVAILYNILLHKEGLSDWDQDTEQFLIGLEKKLKYDKILEVLGKMLNLLNILETNVSKRILFEDFVLNI